MRATRRRRTRPLRFRRSVVLDLRNRLRFAAGGLFVLIGLHVVAMMAFEGLSLGDAIWLTFTTITTTGYGDFSAKTHAGRASTITLIYLSGIFMLTQAGAAFFELRALRRDRQRRGEWRWNMKDHIVFVNAPETEPGDYLRRLLDELHRSHAGWGGVHSLVITEAFPDGLPPDLEDDPLIVQLKGRFDDNAALDAAGVKEARVVVVLAEREGDRRSDSATFDVIHRLREFGVGGRIIAECVDDLNRDRLRNAGASSLVRPMRGYPEMIVRAIVAPGAERIMERLFSSEGDECLRFDVNLGGLTWAEVAHVVLAENFGTAIGFMDASGELHTNPRPDVIAVGHALYVLVDERQAPTSHAIMTALERAARTAIKAATGVRGEGLIGRAPS